MWYTLPGMLVLALIVGSPNSVHAESPALLLEKGIYAEETTGNVDEAIGIYQKIIADAQENRRFVAQASYRLGKCYLKKGDKTKAAEIFKKVASEFADQKVLAAAAIKELATLDPSWTPGGKVAPRPELPPEVMQYITQLHVKAYEQAQAKGLPVNTHIYGVDDEFQKYQGGLLTVTNATTQPVDHEMRMGNTDFVNYDFYNEKGEPQSVRMIERPKAKTGRYRMVWTPDRPIQPGEIRMLGYIDRATPKLLNTAGGYSLRMHNHFGMPVLESFFLVLPWNVRIADSSADYNSVKRIGIFDIYLWQRQVPADTTNEVTVILVRKSPTTQADKLEGERLSTLGWDLWKQRNFVAAEKIFEAAVAKDPANANAWNGLGWSQFNQGKPLAARKAFEQCVTLDPTAAAALNGLGWIAKGEGKIPDAVKYWEKAVAAAPTATLALSGLARTYMDKKDYAAAVKYYEMWVKADPNDAAARQGLQEARKKAGLPPASAAEGQKNQPTTLPAESEDHPAPAGYLIQDSFETGSGLPTGWQRGNMVKGVTYLWDKHTGYDGKASLCLQKTENRYFPIAQWYRSVPYKTTAPALKVSAQVKAQNAAKATLDVLFLGDGGNWIQHQWVGHIGAKKENDPPANHDWKEYSGTVNIPAGTKRIQIGLQIYGPGTVWFDNVTAQYMLEKVANE